MRTLRHAIKPRHAYIAVLLPFEPKFRTTGKTNAERQKEYRERKKLLRPGKEAFQKRIRKAKRGSKKRVTNFYVREASISITLSKSKEDAQLVQMTFSNRGT